MTDTLCECRKRLLRLPHLSVEFNDRIQCQANLLRGDIVSNDRTNPSVSINVTTEIGKYFPLLPDSPMSATWCWAQLFGQPEIWIRIFLSSSSSVYFFSAMCRMRASPVPCASDTPHMQKVVPEQATISRIEPAPFGLSPISLRPLSSLSSFSFLTQWNSRFCPFVVLSFPSPYSEQRRLRVRACCAVSSPNGTRTTTR